MREIRTIQDLSSATSDEIEACRKSINLRGILIRQLEKDARRKSMTRSEYLAVMEAREPHMCPACNGEGQIMPPEPRGIGTIHPSGAHKCVTRLYYDVTGEFAAEEFIPYALDITFEIGHVIHRKIQRALHRAMPGSFEDEVNVTIIEALIDGGHADGEGELDSCDYLLEIKTISEDGFKSTTKPHEDDHLVQGHIYAKARNKPFISYLYVSKGPGHPIKEFVIPYQERVFQEWYLKKAAKVEAALEEGRPPRADASKYECDQCVYKVDCPQRIQPRANALR